MHNLLRYFRKFKVFRVKKNASKVKNNYAKHKQLYLVKRSACIRIRCDFAEKMEVEPSSDLNCQPSTSEQTNSMNSMNDLTAKQAEHVPITSINCNADRTEFNLKELNIKPDNDNTFDRGIDANS